MKVIDRGEGRGADEKERIEQRKKTHRGGNISSCKIKQSFFSNADTKGGQVSANEIEMRLGEHLLAWSSSRVSDHQGKRSTFAYGK